MPVLKGEPLDKSEFVGGEGMTEKEKMGHTGNDIPGFCTE